jgi:hypothetical protein
VYASKSASFFTSSAGADISLLMNSNMFFFNGCE